MKTKHTLKLILAASLALAALAPAQGLKTITPTQSELESIRRDSEQVIEFLDTKLKSIYRKLSAGSPAQIEARLALMGAGAVAELAKYNAARELLLALKPTSNAPAPDLAVFVPQPDGTVTYVAPPEPEVEEVPAP